MHPMIVFAIVLCFLPLFFPEDPLFVIAFCGILLGGSALILGARFMYRLIQERQWKKRKDARPQTPPSPCSCGCDGEPMCTVCAAF